MAKAGLAFLGSRSHWGSSTEKGVGGESRVTNGHPQWAPILFYFFWFFIQERHTMRFTNDIPQESISMIMIVIWISNLFLRLIIMHCLFDLSIKTMWYTGVNVQKWVFLHCYACYALVFIDWTNKTKYSLRFNLKTGHNEKNSRTFMLSKFHFQSVLKLLKQTIWQSSF